MPQRLLTDNGSALNPSRRGYDGQLVAHVKALGVQPITGKPYRPTTQRKNERFHQTLFRFLDKQPIAETIVELQEPVDRFDAIYNTERPHQALPGRITPQQAWDATPKADPPKPGPPPPRTLIAFRTDGRDDQVRVVKVAGNGTTYARGISFQTGRDTIGPHVFVVYEPEGVMIFDDRGTLIVELPWPAPGTRYVGNGKPRGRRPKTLPPSPMS